MIPHIHTLFEFISTPYENQHQTLNMKKIDRGQIKFREYSITLLQPKGGGGQSQMKLGHKYLSTVSVTQLMFAKIGDF